MKIREVRLQNGKFIYKTGISLTKWDSPLQNGILELQTGLSGYYSPYENIITYRKMFINNNLTIIVILFTKIIIYLYTDDLTTDYPASTSP